jgi:hypothetical protein
VVLAGGTAGLASAAGSPATSHTAPVPAACANTSQVTAAVTALAQALVPTPNVTGVADAVGELAGALGSLTQSGCLPSLPTAGTLPVSVDPASCASPLAKAASDAFGLVAQLTAVPPNTSGLTTAATTLVADLNTAVTAGCLPGVTSLPTLPIPPI